MISDYVNYRLFLRDTLSGKQEKSHGFSMRAFANKVGLSQSTLSQVLGGKKNLSEHSALQICEKLKFNSADTEYFISLVRLEITKDPGIRQLILHQMQKLNPRAPSFDLSVDLFISLSDWYHLAIRSLLDLQGFRLTTESASERLNISLLQAESAIERLLRLELIEESSISPGVYKKVHDHVMMKSESANKALRIFHKQMLEKAIDSLESQTPQEKIVGSETFAISRKQLAQANEITEEYFQKMSSLANEKTKKTEVYHLGVQFFKLTHSNEIEK